MYSSAYVWAKILKYLEEKLTDVLVDSWFDEADILEFTDEKLVLYSPDRFRRDTIQKNTTSFIQAAMRELFELEVSVTVLCEEDMDDYKKSKKQRYFLDFNPQYTFEKFVVGSSNNVAHAAALAMAGKGDAPQGYNPLFIYGPSGLGKTHLLYAIASRVHKEDPEANIVYIKAEQFTNELIEAIQSGNMIAYRNKYRTADLFLIDDIQFIAGKESTQEEYFHTFNALYEAKKKIVMTSDRPPASMAKLEDRLRTRMEWGVMTEISPPDYETRMAILKNNADNLGMELPHEVCAFIAENVTSDVRRLEGALNKLRATVQLEKLPIDLALATRVLKNLRADAKASPTASLIISEVCRFYSLDESMIRSNNKSKPVSEARQIIMHLLSTMLGMSSPEVGREIDRDHATVLYGLEKVKAKLKEPTTGIADNIRDITSNINSKL